MCKNILIDIMLLNIIQKKEDLFSTSIHTLIDTDFHIILKHGKEKKNPSRI